MALELTDFGGKVVDVSKTSAQQAKQTLLENGCSEELLDSLNIGNGIGKNEIFVEMKDGRKAIETIRPLLMYLENCCGFEIVEREELTSEKVLDWT